MTPKPSKQQETISSSMIAKIMERLSDGKRVRRSLPLGGRLHIDRTLPFMIVNRNSPQDMDQSTHRLVRGEASYLVASRAASFFSGLSELVSSVVSTLANECESFLLIEIWAATGPRNAPPIEGGVAPPVFRIIAPKNDPPIRTVDALANALKRIKILKQSATVTVVYTQQIAPAGLKPLLSFREAHLRNCFIVGLEVDPIYLDPQSNELYPLVLRSLHRSLSVALKRAAFEFARYRTPRRPPNYQALGRRAFVKAVWEVDQQLARISQSFDLLLLATPINHDRAWNRFLRSGFEKAPSFHYRPLPIDPALVKRRLYQIQIERVEDPTLAFLFREKRMELDRQLTMLLDRGKSAFLYGSLQLYGGVGAELLSLAQQILNSISSHECEPSGLRICSAKDFADQAKAEIEHYRQLRPEVRSDVQVRNDVAGVIVSQGNLLISESFSVAASRAEALLQHEVGTHVLTFINGQAQPFKLLCYGLAGYEALQEGIAVLAEFLTGGFSRSRLRLLAGRVVAADCLMKGASFVETFRELHRTYGFKHHVAYGIALRVHRGGGLTKDSVYLHGLASLLEYIKDGGDMDLLWIGKVALEHLRIIRELLNRKVLVPAPLKPRYLYASKTKALLDQLRLGVTPLDLLKGTVR
jgi:uncharacterized protein (TIGR02421 family)